jgi:hypothetical protein
MALLGRTAEIAQDNDALHRQFIELMPRLPEVRPGPWLPKPESAEQFARILNAPLSAAELLDLGAITSQQPRAAAVHQ